MAKIKLLDFLLTAAAFTALFVLLPSDKEARMTGNATNQSPQLAPNTPENPRTKHLQPTKPGILHHA